MVFVYYLAFVINMRALSGITILYTILDLIFDYYILELILSNLVSIK